MHGPLIHTSHSSSRPCEGVEDSFVRSFPSLSPWRGPFPTAPFLPPFVFARLFLISIVSGLEGVTKKCRGARLVVPIELATGDLCESSIPLLEGSAWGIHAETLNSRGVRTSLVPGPVLGGGGARGSMPHCNVKPRFGLHCSAHDSYTGLADPSPHSRLIKAVASSAGWPSNLVASSWAIMHCRPIDPCIPIC